jgi:hypothetical protein
MAGGLAVLMGKGADDEEVDETESEDAPSDDYDPGECLDRAFEASKNDDKAAFRAALDEWFEAKMAEG